MMRLRPFWIFKCLVAWSFNGGTETSLVSLQIYIYLCFKDGNETKMPKDVWNDMRVRMMGGQLFCGRYGDYHGLP